MNFKIIKGARLTPNVYEEAKVPLSLSYICTHALMVARFREHDKPKSTKKTIRRKKIAIISKSWFKTDVKLLVPYLN